MSTLKKVPSSPYFRKRADPEEVRDVMRGDKIENINIFSKSLHSKAKFDNFIPAELGLLS